MQEDLLHYAWQFQAFHREELRLEDGRLLTVLRTGHHNAHAGPDFLDARIRIDEIEWAGNVEIHINASAWRAHGHHHDPAYANVILHVVWESDKPVQLPDGSTLPTLALQSRLRPSLISRYQALVAHAAAIPCEKELPAADPLIRQSMIDKAAMGRLSEKAAVALERLDRSGGDWEETAYGLMAQNFGFKVNGEPMSQLAERVPLKFILKQGDKLLQIEALLFGQAGLLRLPVDNEYVRLLRREYDALAAKYGLKSRQLDPWVWKFARLRPANFPTLRIAQLSALLFHTRSLFSRLIEAISYEELRALFRVEPSVYWRTHYRFEKTAARRVAPLGQASIDSLIINTAAPLLAAYGQRKGAHELVERATSFLQQMPAERNHIVARWRQMGVAARSAFESQGAIELYNTFCARRRCLSCAIGVSLLQRPR